MSDDVPTYTTSTPASKHLIKGIYSQLSEETASPWRCLHEHVIGWIYPARRRGLHVANLITVFESAGGISRANRQVTIGPPPKVRLNEVARLRGRTGAVVKRPLLFGPVKLPQIVDARVLLRRRPGPDEIRYRDRREQPDYRHHYHQFHQRETPSAFHDSTFPSRHERNGART